MSPAGHLKIVDECDYYVLVMQRNFAAQTGFIIFGLGHVLRPEDATISSGRAPGTPCPSSPAPLRS